MNKSHDLESLEGMNPRTAAKLFDLLAKEWENVSYDDFRNFAGADLGCFGERSRWIPGYMFRDYFAELGVSCGRAFVRLYSERTHKNGIEIKRPKRSKKSSPKVSR